jgi:hypothetical protein
VGHFTPASEFQTRRRCGDGQRAPLVRGYWKGSTRRWPGRSGVRAGRGSRRRRSRRWGASCGDRNGGCKVTAWPAGFRDDGEERAHGASTEMAVSQVAEAGRSRLWPRKGRVSPIGEEDATGMRQGGSFSPRR